MQNLVIDYSAADIKDFLWKIVKVRRMLFETGKNCKAAETLQHADQIHLWISSFPKAEILGISRYFVKNASKIEAIIPGKGASGHERYMDTFQGIHSQCLVIELCREFKINLSLINTNPKNYEMLLQLRDQVQRYKGEIYRSPQEGIRIYYRKKYEIACREFQSELLNHQRSAA